MLGDAWMCFLYFFLVGLEGDYVFCDVLRVRRISRYFEASLVFAGNVFHVGKRPEKLVEFPEWR